MYGKKSFLTVIVLLFLLSFSLAGCGKKQEVDSDIWSGYKGEEDHETDTEEREIIGIGEIPTNKKDIEKLLEDLEKNADKVDLEINENEFDIDHNDIIEENIEDDIEEDINDSDIDAL